MTRMSLLCGMTVFLVLLNLQDATGLGQNATGLGQDATGLVATGPPLNCGVFSTGNPTVLTGMTVFDQKKMLNRFIACIGANSFMDIDGLYFVVDTTKAHWWGTRKCTGLMAATALGFNELARTLIHYYANIEAQNVVGETALSVAALVGNNDMARILLDLGADIEKADFQGTTALIFASLVGHVSTVRLLLERGANINHRNLNGRTALQLALNYSRTNVVALLQSWGR